MKLKLYTIAAISGLCLSANTFATGEGGVAGSVAIHLDGTNVDWASAAIAVGKTTAYAGATSEATVNEAFAVGSGGAITFTGTDIYIQSVAEETVAGLAQEQANDFDNQEVNIDMIDGEVDYID